MMQRLPRSITGEFSLRPPAGESRSYRLCRSWIVIAISGAFLACFSGPLFLIAAQTDFSGIDDLFSLVFLLFNLFWMLGWSVGVAMLAVVFLALLLGRERLIFAPGRLMVRLEILGIGFTRFLNSTDLGEFTWLETLVPDSGTAWRGPHATIGYKDELVSMGTQLDQDQADELRGIIEKRVMAYAPPDDNPRVFSPPPNKADDDAHQVHGPGELSGDIPEQDSLSSIALVIANLVPIAGVLFLGWQVGEVMLLYWAESAVIGFYNIARMWVIGRWSTLLKGPFFLGHYGGFMVVHLLFIYSFMIEDVDALMGTTLQQVVQDFTALAPALVAFFISHGISFVRNFLGRREYIGRTMSAQMSEPYKRIIVMHLTIILGGFLVMAFDSPVPALLLMIALKIGVDLRAHRAEHRG